jgi:hypothetical protein
MKPWNTPPVKKSDRPTPWVEHWLEIARNNPQLITNRQRNKKANEEWIKKSKQTPPTYPF